MCELLYEYTYTDDDIPIGGDNGNYKNIYICHNMENEDPYESIRVYPKNESDDESGECPENGIRLLTLDEFMCVNIKLLEVLLEESSYMFCPQSGNAIFGNILIKPYDTEHYYIY